jgi:hypothetical protein
LGSLPHLDPKASAECLEEDVEPAIVLALVPGSPPAGDEAVNELPPSSGRLRLPHGGALYRSPPAVANVTIIALAASGPALTCSRGTPEETLVNRRRLVLLGRLHALALARFRYGLEYHRAHAWRVHHHPGWLLLVVLLEEP